MTTESTNSTIGHRVLARAGEAKTSYRLRVAAGREDIRAAQALRFLVFNVEMNEGLEHSFDTCLDADAFDDVCDHLLVEDTSNGEVVGTYRLQTGIKAAACLGYYSAAEFDLSPFEPLRARVIELGRACVHSQHRNLSVLSLLWRGIATYARERDGRYLIGCSSVSSQDPKVGASIYTNLQRKAMAPLEYQTKPLESLACPLMELSEQPVKVPKLLSAYLSLGAKICSPPAIDREFKTIDFLTLLDLDHLPPGTVRILQ